MVRNLGLHLHFYLRLHIIRSIDPVCSVTVGWGINLNTKHKIHRTEVEVFYIQYSYFARTSLFAADLKIMSQSL
jgi:hypothetical protein